LPIIRHYIKYRANAHPLTKNSLMEGINRVSDSYQKMIESLNTLVVMFNAYCQATMTDEQKSEYHQLINQSGLINKIED
jgi:hypothetical protein